MIFKKQNLITAVLSIIILSIVVVGIISFFVYQKRLIGFIFIGIGILHLLVLKILNGGLKVAWPDIVFGIIDNGFLVVGAIIGADFGGILGAIIGGGTANAITDGFAGLFEGWTADYLRKKKITQKRTALNSALGKMAGCFFGAGIVLVIFWTILSL